MKTMIQKIFLLIVMFLLSAFVYADMENNSILRFESKKLDSEGGETVYAVAIGDSIYALTANDPLYKDNMANSLWIAKTNVSGKDMTFTFQNVGTGDYLSESSYKGSVGAKKGDVHYLKPSSTPLELSEDEKGYYYIESDYGNNKTQAYIQFDPLKKSWYFYTIGISFPHDPKKETQSEGQWNDNDYPQSNDSTSMKIVGSEVVKMMGGVDNLTIDKIKDIVVDSVERQDVGKLPLTPIEVGSSDTYPLGNYWKTATIQLNVNSADWTPISFPIDVKCVTADLSGVGYQEYDTKARAEKRYNDTWVTGYITSEQVFAKGKAYHFATDSKTMTLEFESVAISKLTKIDNEYQKTLELTDGDELDANWYYIGNALFKDAGMSGINKISRYNKEVGKWEEEPISSLNPFDAFFVQYSGDYAMSALTARTNAPMHDRKAITEKYCLNIVGENAEDRTYLYFEDGAQSNGYVIGEDFLSFATIGGVNTEIYTYEGDIDYSFNTRPIENTLVSVGLYIAKAGVYTISLDNISGNAETFVLYDNYEQNFICLHLGETYTFYSEKGEFNDRFTVAVTYAPGVTTDNILLSANQLTVVNNEIQGLILDSELFVYDSIGRLVCVVNVVSDTMVLPNLSSGIYIVRNGNSLVKFVAK